MSKRKTLASLLLAFSLGLLLSPFLERLSSSLWGPAVWVEAYCDDATNACLYARFERVGGLDYSQFVYLFDTESAARRGMLSYQHVGCEAAYRLSISWTEASSAVLTGPEGCWVEGYMGQTKFTLDEQKSGTHIKLIRGLAR